MSPITTHNLTLGTLLKYIAVFFVVIAFVLYVLFQARFFIYGPRVVFTDMLATVQNERQITLTGIAENIVKITLNDREIVTNQAGAFAEHIVLENGYTIVEIQAHDRYGRTTTLTREFVFTPLSYVIP